MWMFNQPFCQVHQVPTSNKSCTSSVQTPAGITIPSVASIYSGLRLGCRNQLGATQHKIALRINALIQVTLFGQPGFQYELHRVFGQAKCNFTVHYSAWLPYHAGHTLSCLVATIVFACVKICRAAIAAIRLFFKQIDCLIWEFSNKPTPDCLAKRGLDNMTLLSTKLTV